MSSLLNTAPLTLQLLIRIEKGGIYHTLRDTLDTVEPEAVCAALETAVHLIERCNLALHSP